ncbi:exocyst complex component 7-like protein [Corchorus olitorius]|uniref:Exocyst complex component 7-like protein n=1 Tax=Corchorus olitorius TaxID=93759 RepID=A0A1R3IL51_9ROSI|nr:exocyst complex component 7-like protein [Corchorus olitorius]
MEESLEVFLFCAVCRWILSMEEREDRNMREREDLSRKIEMRGNVMSRMSLLCGKNLEMSRRTGREVNRLRVSVRLFCERVSGERRIEVQVWEGSRERKPPWDQDAELANNPVGSLISFGTLQVVEDDKNKLRWQRRELARDPIRSIVFAVYLEFNDLVLAVDTALKLILMPMCQNAIFTVTIYIVVAKACI